MKRKRKPGSARRNLILVALMVLIFAALAVAVRVLNTEAPLILPEGREELAQQRKSPDNAFFTLLEAEKLIPAVADDAPGKNPLMKRRGTQRRGPENPFDSPQEPSLIIPFKEGSPEYLQYLHSCDPAIAKAREALSKPFYLPPDPPTFFGLKFNSEAFRLAQIFVSRGQALASYEGAPAEAAPYLEDALRLVRLPGNLVVDIGDSYRGMQSAANIHRIIRSLAREKLAPAEIAAFQQGLVALGPPFPDTRQSLEYGWRLIDNTLTEALPEHMQHFPESVFIRFFLWRIGRFSYKIIDSKTQLYEMVQQCPAALLKLAPGEEPRGVEAYNWGRGSWFDPKTQTIRIADRIAVQRADYQATLLALALERCQKEKGAYPELLAELAPGYLPEIPQDPIACQPFGYRRQGESYVLYSFGRDGKDDGGKKAPEAHRHDFSPRPRIEPGTDVILVEAQVVREAPPK